MATRTGKILRDARAEKKKQSDLPLKRKEMGLREELRNLLNTYLDSHESLMIEVDPSVLDMFVSILDDSITVVFDFDQVAPTMFMFSNKRVDLAI